MTLQSPKTGETLELIDGDADGIKRHALDLIESSEAMDRAADRLEDICNGTTDLKSEAIATVRESANEVFPELRKAAIRYNGTGEALKTYAAALGSVQGAFARCTPQGGSDPYASMSILIDEIEEANTTAISKRNLEDEAQGLVNEHNGFLGMGEGTDEQKEDAAEGLKEAKSARESAEDELDELWGKFDGRVSYWEDAYDDAVSNIEKAFEAAGNNDRFLDVFMDILTLVGIGLAIAAFVLTGPLAAALALIAVAVSVLSLAIEIGKFMNGDGDWLDLSFAIIGLLPFGRIVGKAASSLGKGFGGFFKAMAKSPTKEAKGMVRRSVKATTKQPKKTPIKGEPHQRRQAREANAAKQDKRRGARNARKNRYMDGFDDSFTESKWKMFTKYVLDNDAAKQRALADYVLENPRPVSRKAEDWARTVKAQEHNEAVISLYYSIGLPFVDKSIDAVKAEIDKANASK